MPSPVGHALGGLIMGLALDQRPSSVHHRPSTGYGGTEVPPSTTPGEASVDSLTLAPFDSRAQGRQGREVPPSTRLATSVPFISAVVACLPDLDFLWGRHNMETHSIGFALLVGVAVYAWQRSSRVAIACTLAVASHVLFDWLGSDDTPPLGVMALWPLSNEFYFASAFVFEAISRRYWVSNFFTHNLLAVAREIVILVPIAIAVRFVRARQK